MKAHFSIEWMAQSSSHEQHDHHQAGAEEDHHHRHLPSSPSVNNNNNNNSSYQAFTAGLMRASGTHPASLPGSYCRRQQSPMKGHHHRRESSTPLHHHHHHHDLHSHTASSETGDGFSSGTEEEETSGYESEGGRSRLMSPTAAFGSGGGPGLSPGSPLSSSSPTPPPPTPPTPPGGRRPRTAFTAEQIGSLERAFKRNAYLGTQDKAELCSKLSLSDKQVRNWFQNRRMKLKRTVQDALAHACQANMASQLLHYPVELHHAAAAYRTAGAGAGPYASAPRYHSDGSNPSSAASYLHCLTPYGSHSTTAAATTAATATSTPTASPALLTLDAFYHHYAAAGLPGVLLSSGSSAAAAAAAAAAQMMASYQPLPQQY